MRRSGGEVVRRRDFLALAGVAAAAAPAGALLAQEAPKPAREGKPGQISIAYLIDDNITLIDFVGPLEAFEDAPQAGVPGFFGYTVGRTRGPFVSQSGVGVTAEYTFDDAPMPKVLVIAAQAQWTPAKLAWIRRVHDHADIVMSVCTGAMLLAETGLLDGLSATTHHEFYEKFAAQYPKVKLVRDKRFVDNGKIITAGGLTSGVDAALHVVERYYGADAAQAAADYMEHRRGPWRG